MPVTQIQSKGTGPRKIVQIASSAEGVDGDYVSTLWALCDDGTLWKRYYHGLEGDWRWVPVDLPPERRTVAR